MAAVVISSGWGRGLTKGFPLKDLAEFKIMDVAEFSTIV